MPPIEMPIMWKSERPSSSTSAFVSSAKSRVVYGPGGAELEPTPRLSNRSTR